MAQKPMGMRIRETGIRSCWLILTVGGRHRAAAPIFCMKLEINETVEDITTIIAKAEDQQSPCPTVRQIIEKRLEETERQFQDLIALRARMTAAIAQWEDPPDRVPDGHMICNMIESVAGGISDDSEK